MTLSCDTLRARGGFAVSRGDHNIKATPAFRGAVRVRGRIKLTFDIVAQKT